MRKAAARKRQQRSQSSRRVVAKGRCASCRVRKARPGRKCCQRCAARHNAYSRRRRQMATIKLRNMEVMLARQQEA